VLRLNGGDGRLRWPASTATESALPFSKLGGPGDRGDRGRRPRPPPIFEVRGFLRLLVREGTEPLETDETLRSIMSPPGVTLADSGLVGFDRPTCLGGCGKEPMLTVFRSDLPTGMPPAEASSASV
jgi:hypothetical protein